MLDYAFTKLH